MMIKINLLHLNYRFTITITFILLLNARGSPIESTNHSSVDENSTAGNDLNSSDYSNVTEVTQESYCVPMLFELEDVSILENRDVYLKAKNITVPSSEYRIMNGILAVCLKSYKEEGNQVTLKCSDKFEYEADEYVILPNNSALILSKFLLPDGKYELSRGILLKCAPEEDMESGMSVDEIFIYIGQVGSAISIISLMGHLLAFIFLDTLRNLPGYNLASLSVAFIIAYSFVLIGQIKEVTGLSCVISAIIQQNFFLSAFFCTNVLAFDVWRSLKLAVEKLSIGSQSSRKRLFIWYSLYAWGAPMVITTISVIIDNSDYFSGDIKPNYGKQNVCWMNSRTAKIIFFVGPVFALLLVNAIFFVLSSWMIFSNTMKVTNEQSKQTVRLNYILYVRLALMMGLTWLVGLIAILSKNRVMWFIFDVLNSLQGLFLFLLFTCTKKVFKQLVQKSSIIKLTTMKQTTLTSNSTSVSTKTDSNGVKA